MNWDAVGAVGEILSAAAVVITLIYLSVQVRAARATTDAGLNDRARDNDFECSCLVLEHAELWVRANSGAELSAADDLRLDRIVHMLSSDSLRAYRRGVALGSGRERVHSSRLAELLHQYPFAYQRCQAMREQYMPIQPLLVGDFPTRGVNQNWHRDVIDGVAMLTRELGQTT